nr:hypothetical protein HmN_000955800 [Hymenolepis microstoma]CUU98417.1 hypothetical transcript [Hymenolepis microstoma]
MSILRKQEISLSAAHAAALATRIAQLTVGKVGRSINFTNGLFAPLRFNNKITVPTLPGINFTYTTNNGSDIKGLFDMFILTLKPPVADSKGDALRSASYSDVFQLIFVIRHSLILPQMRNLMNWPGDGKGSRRTSCLSFTCSHGTTLNS